MSKRKKINENIFSSNEEKKNILKTFFSKHTKRTDFWAVWISGNNIMPYNAGFCFPVRCKIPRILLIFEGQPVNTEHLMTWRGWAEGMDAFDVKVVFYSEDKDIETFLKNNLSDWFKPQPEKEPCVIKKGQLVKVSNIKAQKGEPSLLTLMFGKTGELLSYLDWIKARFRKAFSVKESDVKQYIESISKYLEKTESMVPETVPTLDFGKDVDLIPRFLLLGETGVGKTLFARYLAKGKFCRISIPEYLEKEDMFEYDMFGYAKGAYTGGKESGSLGIMLNNVGGVIFLDEFGEASPKIQAKLLTFLDDYLVKPKGCDGVGFYCPVLIVGATNKPIETDEKYRSDLIQRFTDRQTIPPLRERKENFPVLLDCLLQNRGINIDGRIEEIGKEAYKLLNEKDYKEGNFRELENLMRNACRNAIMDGRSYIVRQDFE